MQLDPVRGDAGLSVLVVEKRDTDDNGAAAAGGVLRVGVAEGSRSATQRPVGDGQARSLDAQQVYSTRPVSVHAAGPYFSLADALLDPVELPLRTHRAVEDDLVLAVVIEVDLERLPAPRVTFGLDHRLRAGKGFAVTAKGTERWPEDGLVTKGSIRVVFSPRR